MASLKKLQSEIVAQLKTISENGPTEEGQASLERLKRSLASLLVSAIADGHRIFLLKEEDQEVPPGGITPFVDVVRNFPDFGASKADDLEFFQSLLDTSVLEGLLIGVPEDLQRLAFDYLQARLTDCVQTYPDTSDFLESLHFFRNYSGEPTESQETLLGRLLRVRYEETNPPSPPSASPVEKLPQTPVARPLEGKDVLFLSYDKPRNNALENYFGFSTCDWAHPDDMKGLQSVHDRIKNRVSHKAQEKAIPKHGQTPVVYTHGFGISAVERALSNQKVLIAG